MTNSMRTNAEPISPDSATAERLMLGVAIAQTAYEINNGHRLVIGKPLRYFDDSALMDAPGARRLNLEIKDEYIVKNIFNDKTNGLNAFIAFSEKRREILIGIAGTNGFGSDANDTKQDLITLGVGQARSLINNKDFIRSINSIIESTNDSNESITNILIGGQSLGGGVASTVGMLLTHNDQNTKTESISGQVTFRPEQISVVSVNGFGNEYSAKLAGFSSDQVKEFNSKADLHRIVVKNKLTGEFDLVSQLGGSFSGTNWILEVEISRGLAALHRMNFGFTEGFNNIYGDFTRMGSGTVPVIKHETMARAAFLLNSTIPIANNPVSLTWASYVALLFSKPGEAAGSLGAALRSYMGIPKPLADAIGVLGEFVLRALPITQATQVMHFLLGSYIGGQLIGSDESPLPVFDFSAVVGPAQEGWTRREIYSTAGQMPVSVIDINPDTGVSVIKQIDGRTTEIHPDGTHILTHPEFGMAVINRDGSGMLSLKDFDESTGEFLSSKVILEADTKLTWSSDGWISERTIDKATNLYERVHYKGVRAEILEAQLETGPDGKVIGMRTTKAFAITLQENNLTLPEPTGLREFFFRVGPGHIRTVLRDEDRRTIQTIDVLTTGGRTEMIYKDAQGRVERIKKVEQLNATAAKTTLIGEDGSPTEITVVQRYRRHGELFELEDRTDIAKGIRTLTVRDSERSITKSEAIPIDGEASEYYLETVRDQLDNDIADFLTALRQKDTAGIILSTARIALDYARSQGIATLPYDTVVADASSALALVSSLRALQSGDTMAKIGGTVGLLNSTNYFAARLTGSGYLTGAQATALSQIGAVLAIANLANLVKMVESGQIGSAGATIVSAINGIGYLSGTSSALMGSGAIVAINPIALVAVAILGDVLFGEDPPPPPPQGTVTFYRNQESQLTYRITESNKLGERILHRELAQLLPALEQQLHTVNEHIPDSQHKLTLIASRMPTIQISGWPTHDDNGVDNYFFVMEQQDPMRDDPGYVALSRKDLVKLYPETLLLPEALAQQWEIDHLRKKFGTDEAHWQTEGEWLRGRSPIERERSRLQQASDQAQGQWETASKFGLMLGHGSSGSEQIGNVMTESVVSDQIGSLRQAMETAKAAVNAFNLQHPADPLQAARATPEEAAAFALARGTRESIALQWMKLVVVDLGNDGVQTIDLPAKVGTDLESLQNQRITRFDVDGDGFREATQWISPADAILGIERSGNDILDNGSELFHGADTPFDQHGIGSLAFHDANGDGLLTHEDPVYRQLRLWIDLDGDGSSGELEVFDLQMRPVSRNAAGLANPDLASMAVDAIDLGASSLRFADGSSAALTQLDLLSHTKGVQVVKDIATGNLNVLHEDGLRENFVTLVDDMSALQELQSPNLSAVRRNQLETLARRYGLNPASDDFASIVQSLRSAGETIGEQDTVIYFGDDKLWSDPAIREQLEQKRISFRKLNDTTSGSPGSSSASLQLLHTGHAVQAEALAPDSAFDDRWVPSRRVGSADIVSDAAQLPAEPETTTSQQSVAGDIYSLLMATKGAQAGKLVQQQAAINSEPRTASTPGDTSSIMFSTAQPVATLNAIAIDADEDAAVSVSYQSLAQAGERLLASDTASVKLQLIGIRSASHGTVHMDDQSGHLEFRPHADHAGDASVVVVLADQQGQTYEQALHIRLRPVNDAPRVAGESIVSAEDVPLLIDPLTLLSNDLDADGDRLVLTGIARVALGRAELLGNGQIHYTPPSDQYGVTDTLDYIVQDSQGASSVARIHIRLDGVDDAPSVVTERVINAREDQQLRIAPQLLLRNDFDVDTDSRIGSKAMKITAVGSTEHGMVRFEQGGDIVFRPDANFNGDASFSYTVMDDSGLATTGRALVRIGPMNDVVLAAGERIASREDERLWIDPALLLKNEIDTDIERDEKQVLSVVAVDAAVGGKVQLIDGLISFIPDTDRLEPASFRYTVSDGAGGFDQATVDIELAEVNDAPVLPALRFDAIEDTELILPATQLLTGAIDVDGDPTALSVVRTGKAAGGTIALVDGLLHFRPNADFAGVGSFEYLVTDERGAETTGIATIDVNNSNDAPVPLTDSAIEIAGVEDREIRIAESMLEKFFRDADGDALRLDPNSLLATDGADSIDYDAAQRELVLRAAPDVHGLRQFSLAMSDGQQSSLAQTLTLNLQSVNDAPIVRAVGFEMLEDGGENNPTKSAWTYLSHEMLLSGAADADGDALKITRIAGARTTGVAQPAAVEWVNEEASGRVALRAPLNYHGAIELEFTVSDGQGGETTQKAYGSVVAVNDAPFLTVRQIGTNLIQGRSAEEVSTWQVDAWDPDTSQGVKLAIERNPLRGKITLGKTTNTPDARGGQLTTASITAASGHGNTRTTESASLSATDSSGASSQISLSLTGRYFNDPIVIDFDRDGLSFVDIERSSARFVVDGLSRRSAWIGAREGILAFDANQDGQVNGLEEIAFGAHVGQPGLSDLQALQELMFDQNQDAVFDAQDSKWVQFLIWRDLNGNGVSDTGELQSLEDAGVRGLYLNANVLNRAAGVDVRVRGYTRVLMDDGSLRQAADVWLGLENLDAAASGIAEASMQQASQLGADQFENLLQQIADAPREGNRAPMIYGYLPTQFADEGQAFRLELAPNFFIDADTLDPLHIDARQADGTPLPDWLRWNPETLRFDGIPQAADAGNLQIALIATDHQGASARMTFSLVTEARATALSAASIASITSVGSGDSGDGLRTADHALSQLLSAVAAGNDASVGIVDVDSLSAASPPSGAGLLSGFTLPDRAGAAVSIFATEPLAAAVDTSTSWNGPGGDMLPAWVTPDTALAWRPPVAAPSVSGMATLH